MFTIELIDKISRYIENEIKLEELENWIVEREPILISDPDSVDASLVAAVELCLAEFSDGVKSEDEIRTYLRNALQEHNTIFLEISESSAYTRSGMSDSFFLDQAYSLVSDELVSRVIRIA